MDKVKYYFLVFFVGLSTYACNAKRQTSCKVKEVRTIFFDRSNNGFLHYIHYVLIKDYDRKCMDSTTMVNMAKKYADTISEGRPATMIKFFNSDRAFIPNEVSQPMRDIQKSGLVTISFNKKMEPTTFTFYDENDGSWLYDGTEWKPKG